jgi:UDP-glucose 4-epimerase
MGGLRTDRTVLVTGATGKVGRALVARLVPSVRVRALCHSRALDEPGVEVVTGDISSVEDVGRAMEGVTHVVHLATSKETPDTIMDVAVKGLFWLLEASLTSPTFEQLVLVGGDAAIGHAFFERDAPLTEATPHAAYPGCYALSKVLEEVMVEQYGVQYDLDACCLRAPWLMEKDDFRFTLSFGDDVFGGPPWRDLVESPAVADDLAAAGTVPLGLAVDGAPLRRSFLHVSDLVEAIVAALGNPAAKRQLFNIAMDEPLDYGIVARHLAATRGLPVVEVPTSMHSVWLDNAKARSVLGWRPAYDAVRLADEAFDYIRAPGDTRHVFYPG